MAKVIELVLDEDNYKDGVFAISLVEQPAIEADFIALSKEYSVQLKTLSEEKRLVTGAILIPDFKILRKDKATGEDYYIYFSKETIAKASQIYLKKGNQNNATLEHTVRVEGLSIVESWIKEDEEKDKSVLLGIEAPVGSWIGTMKVDNDEVWLEYVKTGKVKGFSIEGLFEDINIVEANKQLEKIEEMGDDEFLSFLDDLVDHLIGE